MTNVLWTGRDLLNALDPNFLHTQKKLKGIDEQRRALRTEDDFAKIVIRLPKAFVEHVPTAWEATRATGVSIDTRTLSPGDLFMALKGEHRRGDAFVADAWARGAAAVISETADDPAVFGVTDTLAALTALGAFGRARFGGRLAAVTGSVGKTTTKEMLRAVLSARGAAHAAHASHNNHWGVPLTLARLPANAAFCVVEIGMNHAGEILPLAKLARPHVAVVTAVEAAHVGHLGSVEAIADEKAQIFRALEPGGVAVMPGDSPHLDRLRAAAGDARIVTFGTDGDARLVSAQTGADRVIVQADVAGRSVRFTLRAPGRHMAMNAVAALAAAEAMGVDPHDGARALEGFAAAAGRGARRAIPARGGQAMLIDESYNASPASVRAALAVLGAQPGRRVAVLGDMLELGDSARDLHAGLAADAAAGADVVFACGPHMRALYDALPSGLRGDHAAGSEALAPIVAEAVRAGDAVLVKGSLGSAMRRVVSALEPV